MVLGQVVVNFSVKYLRSVEISENKKITVYRKIQLYFHGGYKTIKRVFPNTPY